MTLWTVPQRLYRDANELTTAARTLRTYQAGDGNHPWLKRKLMAFVIGFLNGMAGELRREADAMLRRSSHAGSA